MKQLHLWLSIPVGLVISITCFSGAMLIFEREITESVQREYYFVEEVGTQRISFEDAIAAVEPMLDAEQRITGITTFSDLERAWKVGLSTPRGAAVYVDQYMGAGQPIFISINEAPVDKALYAVFAIISGSLPNI